MWLRLILLAVVLTTSSLRAWSAEKVVIGPKNTLAPKTENKTKTYQYADPVKHRWQDDAANLAFIWFINIGLYAVTLGPTVKDGSFSEYRRNLGRTVLFDNDEPKYNWVLHPYSGSQLYLYYRANAYTRSESFRMAFLSSLLFEYTIEPYTEPASLVDVVNTPLLGSALGYAIEKYSIAWINSGVTWKKWLGHAINPMTLLPFFKNSSAVMAPQIGQNGNPTGMQLSWSF